MTIPIAHAAATAYANAAKTAGPGIAALNPVPVAAEGTPPEAGR